MNRNNINKNRGWLTEKEFEEILLRDKLNTELLDLLNTVPIKEEKSLVKKVIKNGNINYQDKNEISVLTLAIDYNKLELVKLLIMLNANINIQQDIYNTTPLHWSINESYYDMAELLIKNGADINIQNIAGNTALHIAVHKDNLHIVELLVEHNANVYIKNKDGKTALDIAREHNKSEIENILINGDKNKSVEKLLLTLIKLKELKLKEETIQKEKLENSKSYKIEKEIERLYTGETCIFPKDALRQIWDEAKKDEIILGEVLKTEKVINYPYFVSLMLMDHENIDPLAYEILVKKILDSNSIMRLNNPIIKKYNYDLLTTLLFDKHLYFSYKDAKNVQNEVSNRPLPFSKEWFWRGKDILDFPQDGLDSIYLRDIRYWLLTHPTFEPDKELFRILFNIESSLDYFKLLLEDYEERVKLRNLTKMPF